MGAIGVSIGFNLLNSFYVKEWKFFSVLKAIYPLLFHLCFVVFMVTTNNYILILGTVTCLGVFFLGSVHHLLETAVSILKFAIVFFKNHCLSSDNLSAAKTGRAVQKHPNLKRKRVNLKSNNPKPKSQPKTVHIKDILKKMTEELDSQITKRPKNKQSAFNTQKKKRGDPRKKVKMTKDHKHDT